MIDGKKFEYDYFTVVEHKTETRSRFPTITYYGLEHKIDLPYVTYSLEYDNTFEITMATQQGKTVLQVLLSVLSDVGGLMASILGVSAVFVGFFTVGDFQTHVTKNFYMAKRYDVEEDGKDYESQSHKIVASQNVAFYEKLKENTAQDRVDKEDIDNMMEVLRNRRYPLVNLIKEQKFYILQFAFAWLLKLCLRGKKQSKSKF